MSIDRRTNKQTQMYAYNGILVFNKKNELQIKFSNINKPQKYVT